MQEFRKAEMTFLSEVNLVTKELTALSQAQSLV